MSMYVNYGIHYFILSKTEVKLNTISSNEKENMTVRDRK